MSSIRNLKKDINNVLGAVLEAVYLSELQSGTEDYNEGDAIINETAAVYDDLIAKVNQKEVENRKAHLKQVREELRERASGLINKITVSK